MPAEEEAMTTVITQEDASAINWYRELTPVEKCTFWACFGGWALDAMDVQIFSFVIPASDSSAAPRQGGRQRTERLGNWVGGRCGNGDPVFLCPATGHRLARLVLGRRGAGVLRVLCAPLRRRTAGLQGHAEQAG